MAAGRRVLRDSIGAMTSNPFITALTAITSVFGGIALIAWVVSLSNGSGFAIAVTVLTFSFPGAFLALLSTLIAGALTWKAPKTTSKVTERPPVSRHWLDQSPEAAAAENSPSEPDNW